MCASAMTVLTGWPERSQGRREVRGAPWSWDREGRCTISTWSQRVCKHMMYLVMSLFIFIYTRCTPIQHVVAIDKPLRHRVSRRIKDWSLFVVFISLSDCLSRAFSLMVVTHSQETCTSRLVQETWPSDMVSCTSFLHRIQHSSVTYKKLACTWLEWWALIGRLPIAATVSIFYPVVSLSLPTFQFFVCYNYNRQL